LNSILPQGSDGNRYHPPLVTCHLLPALLAQVPALLVDILNISARSHHTVRNMAVEQSESMPHFADHLFPFQLAAQHQPSRQECNREHEPVCLERQVYVAAKNEIDQVGDLRAIYSKCKIKIYLITRSL
jgi:hypothetical protein